MARWNCWPWGRAELCSTEDETNIVRNAKGTSAALPLTRVRLLLTQTRPIALSRRILAVSVLLSLSVLPLSTKTAPAADYGRYITFDVPGSSCQADFFTCMLALAINAQGSVIGTYADANQGIHGFLRTADGKFEDLDPPRASCPSFFSFCSYPVAINDGGTIAGWYATGSSSGSYIRAADGTFTLFNDPDAFCCTTAASMNAAGTVVGTFGDQNFVTHGFIRTTNGKFATLDVAGATSTQPITINDNGTIAGNFSDANGVQHGFVRNHDEDITTFDPPGSVYTTVGTPSSLTGLTSIALNASDQVIGSFQGANFIFYAYSRTFDGRFKKTTGPGSMQTGANGINVLGVITGSYYVAGGLQGYGFVWAPYGSFTSFSAPGAVYTYGVAINGTGVVVGNYIDSNYLQHGYIRLPSLGVAAVAGD
jgi:hypothetical protein